MSIPKIIFQTSVKPAPDYIRNTFSSISPSWKYLHFTDADIISYFAKHPSEEFPRMIETFNSFERGEHKADLFRYYFLYLNGGLFVDSDAIPKVPLDEIVKNYSSILVLPFDPCNGIYNGIIGSTPRCPLVYQALSHCYNTSPELLKDCYHYFCKSLFTLSSIHKPSNCVFYQEVDKVQEGIEGSIVVDKDGTHLFTHYWKLGAVPNDSDLIHGSFNRSRKNKSFSIANRDKSLNNLIGSALRLPLGRLFKILKIAKNLDYTNAFQDVYENNKWGCGSGPGSSEKNTTTYNKFVIDLLRTVEATQVTDIGCGDWQSSHLIYENLGPIDYLGIDCTASVIKSNKNKYPRFSFTQLDVVKDINLIRDSEVYIIKDVLQHLRTKDIYKILDGLTSKSFKYIIITNCSDQKLDNENLPRKKDVAYSRGLSANYYPLKKYGAIPLVNYFGGDDKEISIIFNRTCWNDFLSEQTWAFNKECLQVIDTGSSLQRIGPNSDGGYVIYPGLKYDLFISCGIAQDVRFEEAFIAAHDNIKCLAYDGTIDSLPDTKSPIEWIKKNIAAYPRLNESDLTESLDKISNAFLKMDIEGSEFDWITNATTTTLKKFAQIVLEVHWPFDLYRSKALAKLNKTHYPIHVHGNNYNDLVISKSLPSGRSADGKILLKDSTGSSMKFPEVFEVTYIRKDLVPKNSKKIHKSFPTELDYPNCPLVPDHEFTI